MEIYEWEGERAEGGEAAAAAFYFYGMEVEEALKELQDKQVTCYCHVAC